MMNDSFTQSDADLAAELAGLPPAVPASSVEPAAGMAMPDLGDVVPVVRESGSAPSIIESPVAEASLPTEVVSTTTAAQISKPPDGAPETQPAESSLASLAGSAAPTLSLAENPMIAQFESMAQQILQHRMNGGAPPAQSPTAATPTTRPAPVLAASSQPAEAAPALDTPAFSLTDDEFDEAISSKAGLEKLFSKMIDSAVGIAAARAQQGVYQQALPALQQHVVETLSLQSTVTKFWDKNSDLMPARQMVALAVNDLQMQHQDWSHEHLLEEAGKSVRNFWKSQAAAQGAPSPVATSTSPATPARPAFAGGSKGVSPGSGPKRTWVEDTFDL